MARQPAYWYLGFNSQSVQSFRRGAPRSQCRKGHPHYRCVRQISDQGASWAAWSRMVRFTASPGRVKNEPRCRRIRRHFQVVTSFQPVFFRSLIEPAGVGVGFSCFPTPIATGEGGYLVGSEAACLYNERGQFGPNTWSSAREREQTQRDLRATAPALNLWSGEFTFAQVYARGNPRFLAFTAAVFRLQTTSSISLHRSGRRSLQCA